MGSMTFRRLQEELDLWAAAGRTATFWWRDDDAVSATEALFQLLHVARGTPLTLAVVPKFAKRDLAELIGSQLTVTVAQHGWAHVNHAPEGEKKCEFGKTRPIDAMIREIRDGRARLASMFGPRFLPVFVPPWNRISQEMTSYLPILGLATLSTIKPRTGREAAPHRLNVHADIMDWRGNRGFLGAEAVEDQIVKHLRARREEDDAVDSTEPTGLMTHHLVHDADCWAFLAEFFDFLDGHDAARWLTLPDALSTNRQGSAA